MGRLMASAIHSSALMGETFFLLTQMGNEIEFTIDGAGLKGALQTQPGWPNMRLLCLVAARSVGNFC